MVFESWVDKMLMIIQEKEKEGFEATIQSMKSKLEISESNRIHAEVEAAKLRSIPVLFSIFIFTWDMEHHFHFSLSGQLESELSVQTQLLSSKDAELVEAREKVFFFFFNNIKSVFLPSLMNIQI